MNELYHYGVRGMKWGVIKEKYKMSNNAASAYDRYALNQLKRKNRQLEKQSKRRKQIGGDAANQKYMTDAERNIYAKGRVKTMGSKARALSSESSKFIGSTVKTAGIGIASSLGSALGVGTITMLTASSAVKAGLSFVVGAATGGVPVLAISTGVLAATTIARGSRYIKNMNAIKNV